MLCCGGQGKSYTFNDIKGEIRSISISIKEERREGIQGAIAEEDDEQVHEDYYIKSDEDRELIQSAIKKNEFMQNVLKEDQINSIVDAMYLREISADETIIIEGEAGFHLFVAASGTFTIFVGEKEIGTFNDIRVFGELAILYKAKRLATVKAFTDGKVWVINRNVYQKIIVRSAKKDEEDMVSFLRNVPDVNKLSDGTLMRLSHILKSEFFAADTVIVEEGDVGNKFYIIRAGSVSVTKDKEGKVAELHRGDFFGERALLQDDRRQATVTATAPGVECLTLTRAQFLEHFDENIFNNPTSDSQPKNLDSVAVDDKIQKLDLDEFARVATLGVGGFGRVELIQHNEQKHLTFALKYIKKVDVVDNNQIDHVFNEKNIQIKCNSKFIVKMYRTFRDTKYLYFLMESCMGGDLWSLLQRQKTKRVSESAAKFYSACVLEALSYLHERDCVYRDLKPENLLLNDKGYVKITDFGFARILHEKRTYTFAGTPEYVAPEIIYNRGHDRGVDYWAFGILIFELMVGKTPFRSNDPTHMKTYQNILKGIDNVTFSKMVTNNAGDLIRGLCKSSSNNRLGCQKKGIQDIRNHKWYSGYDWQKLREGKIRAPDVPKLSSNIDTRYFDKFSRDVDDPPDDLTGWDREF